MENNNECVFCDIISGKIPANLIAESDTLIVLKDQSPKAPIHYLIIPKRHIRSLHSVVDEDQSLLGEILLMAKDLSVGLDPAGFRLISNNGKSAGQSVDHMHIHFLAGKQFSEENL